MFMANPELSDPVGRAARGRRVSVDPRSVPPDAALRAHPLPRAGSRGHAVRDGRRGAPRADLPARDRPPRRDALHRPARRRGSSRRDGAAPADRDGHRRTRDELRRSDRRILAACVSRSSATTPGRSRRFGRSPRSAGHRGRARRHEPAASRRAGIAADADGGRGRGRATLDLPLLEVGPGPRRRGLRRPRLAGARRDRRGRVRRDPHARRPRHPAGSAR